MSELPAPTASVRSPGRPYPWSCPKCRHQEVWLATIPNYQCERAHNGLPVPVTVRALQVPQCGHCGELVFNYAAEEQINQAYQALVNGAEYDRHSSGGSS